MQDSDAAAPPQALSFGKLLRRYRLDAGLTQEELAERTGLSVRGLGDLERGVRRTPYPDTVQRLAEALALSEANRAALMAARRVGARVYPLDPLVLRSHRGTANPVPEPLTSFVGREHQLAEADALLQRARLVTLVGPGGVGKTRLAIQVSRGLLNNYEDGVCFVSLAPLSDAGLVIATVAEALSVREAAGTPLYDSLTGFLRRKHLLLVMDNFEQVVEAGRQVAELLAACPRLTVLVTSREALHVSGEFEFVVPPLQLANATRTPEVQQLVDNEAVRLFIERARAVRSGFTPSPEDLRMIADICRRVDGLPLAIELAAAWTKLFLPQALVGRLEQRLPVLVHGPRDLPARQQSMRDTISWSYSCLDYEQQALFRRLGVFVGGSTLGAVEAVCSDPGETVMDVLEGLGSLVDKSLLRPLDDRGGDPRFVLLETVREFTLERLAERGETDALRFRHAAYYLTLAEQAGRELRGDQRTARLSRLELELDNLRAALRWAEEQEDAQLGLRLAGALYWFWHRNHRAEGQAWLSRMLALPGARAVPGTRVRALTAASRLAWWQGDYDGGNALLREAVSVAQQSGDKNAIALTLRGMALTAMFHGDYAPCRPLLEESLSLYSEASDSEGTIECLRYLGLVALEEGDLSLAWSWADRSRALARETGDSWGIAEAQIQLSTIARHRGDLGAARSLAEDALLLGPTGEPGSTARALASLGLVAYLEDDHASARAHLLTSLRLFHELGEKPGIAAVLEGLMLVAAAQEDWVRVLRLGGAASALRETIGSPTAPTERAPLERAQARAHEVLGEPAAALAWETGRISSPTELIEALLSSELTPQPIAADLA